MTGGAGASLSRLLTVGGFIAAGLLFAVMEVLARREGSKLPTLGELCGHLLRYRAGGLPVGRILLYGLWWWLGWHLFAR